MKNKQLTLEQRYYIQTLLQVNTSKKEIAQAVDTSTSTIYREISRNKHKRGYTAHYAQISVKSGKNDTVSQEPSLRLWSNSSERS
jgi:IS30 family transposase